MANKWRICAILSVVRNERVCTVKGKDYRGYPLTVKVDAYTVMEAAARGLHEIVKDGGQVSALQVTEHTPGKSWNVAPEQLLKYVSKRDRDDNLGLQSVKRNVRDALEKKSGG